MRYSGPLRNRIKGTFYFTTPQRRAVRRKPTETKSPASISSTSTASLSTSTSTRGALPTDGWPRFSRPASRVVCDSAAERRQDVAVGVSPWKAHWRHACRCFATQTPAMDEFLGLVSEAVAWHCFAIQSQSGRFFGWELRLQIRDQGTRLTLRARARAREIA